jgi:hypothetical protein
MTAWNILWKAVKSYLGWLIFTTIFILAASFLGGFKAYCPLTAFIGGSVILFVIILIIGLMTGAWNEHR